MTKVRISPLHWRHVGQRLYHAGRRSEDLSDTQLRRLAVREMRDQDPELARDWVAEAVVQDDAVLDNLVDHVVAGAGAWFLLRLEQSLAETMEGVVDDIRAGLEAAGGR